MTDSLKRFCGTGFHQTFSGPIQLAYYHLLKTYDELSMTVSGLLIDHDFPTTNRYGKSEATGARGTHTSIERDAP